MANALNWRSSLSPVAGWAAAFLLLITLAGGLLAPARAELQYPELTGRVVDDAHLLSAEQQAELTAKLKALEDKNGRQVVVATVPSLQGDDIEDFAVNLGRHWAIGQKGKNDGTLFLIAPSERKVRIEAGPGVQDVLTDAMTGVIIDRVILPRFKAGDMAGGIMAGTDAIVQQLGLDPEAAHAQAVQAAQQRAHYARSHGSQMPKPLAALFVLIGLFFMVRMILRGRGGGWGWFIPLMIFNSMGRRDGGWGGGGFGGGGGNDDGFSGGGGGFDGGGSSGSW
ncbi:MAG: TPM domain-containing protein [Pseudomonadota bacterium]|jgi:uncharacterized protein